MGVKRKQDQGAGETSCLRMELSIDAIFKKTSIFNCYFSKSSMNCSFFNNLCNGDWRQPSRYKWQPRMMWHEDQHLSWDTFRICIHCSGKGEVMFCHGDWKYCTNIRREKSGHQLRRDGRMGMDGVYIILSWSYNTITLTYENFQIASPAHCIAVTGAGDAWAVMGRPMREGELTTDDQ